jgi:CheY-like chemotaxis protein
MDFNDLDEGRVLHAALADIFVAQAGGREHPEVLERVEKLCDAAIGAVDDVECRVAIRGVRTYSRLFFSDDGHVGIESGSLTGVDYLRLRIHNCLSSFRGRLNAIESQRLHIQRVEFELRRRRQMEPPALSAEAHYQPMGQRGIRVLVVEDNRDSADTLRQLLYSSGYEVAVAYTGHDGLRAAKRMKPEIILCDIGLPDTNGFVVASALREDPQTCGARLIAVTAYGRDEDRRRAREAGFDLHLVKPVDPGVLLNKVGEAFAPRAS